MKRKAITKRVRFEIFKRDGFTCQYCGSTPPAVTLHVDHIHPVAKGGGNEDENLTTACSGCNSGKSDVLLSAVSKSLAERAAEVAERESQLKGFTKIMRAKTKRIESEAWEVADIFVDAFHLDGIRKDFLTSIRKFLDRLHVSDCVHAMDLATSKSLGRDATFRYFCGICWGMIRAREQ